MAQETPQRIAELRQVTVERVLRGDFDLSRYPYHYIAMVATQGAWHQRLATALAAADLLVPVGFHLVNVVEFPPGNAVCAVLRRS